MEIDDQEQMMRALGFIDEPDAEEMLYWSSPHYEVLMAEREEKQKRLQEEKGTRENV